MYLMDTVDPSSNAVNDVTNDSTAAIYSMVPVFLHKYLKARTRNETTVKGMHAHVNLLTERRTRLRSRT